MLLAQAERELYVGFDDRVGEFGYRRGGPKKPSVVIATWASYKKAGPLLISTDRRGTADGKPLRIFFSDVSVKLVVRIKHLVPDAARR